MHWGAAAAAAAAFITVSCTAFVTIRWFRKHRIGEVIRPEGPPGHAAKSGTPTMGGIGIALSVLIVPAALLGGLSAEGLLMAGSVFIFALIGWVDDLLKIRGRGRRGLTAREKLSAQGTAAAGMVMLMHTYGSFPMTYLYIPWFFQQPIDIGPVYYPLAVIYVVMLVNAVNLTDGLDGLAAGLGMLAAGAGLIIALAGLTVIPGIHAEFSIQGSGEIALFLAALFGALAGFLVFNRKPARLFMGDTGSQAVGGMLAAAAILLRSEIVFLVISGMFLIEACSVILQVCSCRLRQKRLFRMAPLHHHYELAGKQEGAIVRAFWGIGACFALAGTAVILFG